MDRDRRIQIIASLILALCLASSGVLAVAMTGVAGRARMTYTDRAEQGQPWEVSAGIAMGAFRGVFVNFLWLRANEMKEAGKFYEAIGLADAITRLQPRFPRVWVFHAWNMSYNISVATQTASERWKWVSAGIELLRDKGIPANPNDMLLHKELGWIFLHKIGGYTDDANPFYKRRLAVEWTAVLGPPPPRTSEDRNRAHAVAKHAAWLSVIADAPDTLEGVVKAQPVAGLLADRLRSEINDGQTDFLLVIPFILALGWLGRRPVLAGVALGFAFHIKYLAIVFLPYLIIRGRWREAGAMVASIVGWALVSAPVFGWSRNLDYLAVAGRGMVRMTGVRIGGQAAPLHGIEWNSSVSIPSAMARAARSLDAGPGFVLAASAMVALLTFGAAWLVYLRAGVPLFRGRTPARDDADPGRRLVVGVEWCGLIVAALAFSPQTMARHMIILYPMTFFTLTLLLRGRPGWTRGPLLAGYWLATLAIILPPGGVEGFKPALTAWRGVGGASWTLLAYFLAFLWSGLREAGGIGRGLPAGPHPGMNPQIPSTLGVVQVQEG